MFCTSITPDNYQKRSELFYLLISAIYRALPLLVNPSLADPDRRRVGWGWWGGGQGVFKGDNGALIFGALGAEGTAIGGHCNSCVQVLHLATAIVM